MTHTKLSICIATLNRADYLGATLDSIESQAREGLEIVIVDGASTDGTPELVELYRARYQNIQYVRLDAKGGVDQDYCRAVGHARGDYCWLFTDDDLMRPGAIDAVWSALDRGYDLVVVNGDVRDATMATVLEASRLPAQRDTEYPPSDFERLFVDTASYMSFIGCVVIKRTVWESRDRASYFGTVFVHVGTIFQRPLDGPALVIAAPYISIRYGNSLWTPSSFNISMFKWPKLIWSFEHFSEGARRAVSEREPWRGTALLVYRARGAYGSNEYARLVSDRISGRAERLYARTVALLPGCVLNALLLSYLTLAGRSRSNRELRLVDLRSSSTYYRRCLFRRS